MSAPPSLDPLPLATQAPYRLLAWPSYRRDDDLDVLLEQWMAAAKEEPDLCLCLRCDPDLDPPPERVRRRLKRRIRERWGRAARVPYLLVDGPLPAEQLARLGAAVTWIAKLPTSQEAERTAFHLAIGADLVEDRQELGQRLEARRLEDEGVQVYGASRTTTVQVGGRTISFSFPHTPGILPHIQNILNGQEYPLFLPGDYRPAVVVDIGGHIGTTAVHFAAAYPDARVLCFEPSSQSFAYLEANVRAFPNVEAHNFGLLDRDGELTLHYGPTSSMENSLWKAPEGDAGGSEAVQLRRASEVLRELGVERVSVLKIDTEGSEIPILRDLEAWIPDMEFLYVEYHSESDRRAIEDLLGPHFELCAARADVLHRGSNVYVAKRIIERFPVLGEHEIAPR